MAAKFVVYYRVSTTKQGEKGLGIEAQRAAVKAYLDGREPLQEFTEVESARSSRALAKRPELNAAITLARRENATLVIAKLDRLGRNVHFVTSLYESKVNFVCCDNPHANKLTIYIMAVMAEHEADLVSERTRAALATVNAKLARGEAHVSRASGKPVERLGGRPASAYREEVEARLAPFSERLTAMRRDGLTIRSMVARLNDEGVASPRGGRWHIATVQRALASLQADAA